MLDQAYSAFQNKDFSSAIEILTKMKKDSALSPKARILLLLCSYQAGSSAELLQKNQNNPITLQKIATRSDWKELLNALPSEQSEYVTGIMDYCAINLGLSGDADKILEASRPATASRSVEGTMSAMDEEEADIDYRNKKLKKARKAGQASTINDYIDSIKDPFEPDTPSGPNPALFILSAGSPGSYNSRSGLRTNGVSAIEGKNKPGKPSYGRATNTPYGAMHRPSGKNGASDNTFQLTKALSKLKRENLSQDEMLTRRSALIERIDALEQSILSGES